MGMFDHFPYTNFHELNLDWILQALKEIEKTMDQFVAINSLKYADPIQWSIIKQYEKNTIVIDPLTGTAYISAQAVPSGVALTNTDYWTVVFDLRSFVVRAAKNFTLRWEEATTLTATMPVNQGQWVVWGDTLYRALSNIIAGDQYVIDSNIKRITVEEIKDEIYQTFNNIIGDLADLDTTDRTNLVAAINSIIEQNFTILGFPNENNNENFSQTYTAGTIILWYGRLFQVSNEVDAGDPITGNVTADDIAGIITNIYQTFNNSIGTLEDLDTTDKTNLVAAINSFITQILNILGFANENNNENFSQAYTAGTIILWYGRLFQVSNDVDAGDPITGNVTGDDIAGIITDIYTKIEENVSSKDIIILASSIGTTPDSDHTFIKYIEPLLKPTYKNVYSAAASGAGFVYKDTYNYLELLQNLVVDDPDKVSDILIVGTGNDVNTSHDDLFTAIGVFSTYAHTRFPNAKIQVASSSSNPRFADHKANAKMYIQFQTELGDYNMYVLPYSYNIMATSYLAFTDNTWHNTIAGSKFLATALAENLLYGRFTWYQSRPLTPSSVWLPSNLTLDSGSNNSFADADGLHLWLSLTFTPTANVNVYSNFNTPLHLLDTTRFSSSIIDASFPYYNIVADAFKDCILINRSTGNTIPCRASFFYKSDDDIFTFGIVAPVGNFTLESGTQYTLLVKTIFNNYEF